MGADAHDRRMEYRPMLSASRENLAGKKTECPPGYRRSICALAILLNAFVPFPVHAASDLHGLYNALQTKGQAVTIPATVLGRLKLGLPASDILGKEIIVSDTNRDKRGITAFELTGIPYLAMFHIEANYDDAWLIRFSLDGHILNQEWNEGGYRTYEIQSSQVAEREVGFWRERLTPSAHRP